MKPNSLYPDDNFEQFIALPENNNRPFELINGEIHEKRLTEEQGILILEIGSQLLAFVKANNSGRVGVETLYHNPQDRLNYRLPDIAFTADATPPVVTRGAVLRFPDLAVEVKSPEYTYRTMRDKAAYYLANGVKLIWLVYPEKRLIEVYRADGDIQILDRNDTLDGGDVLPGFSLAVSAIFKA